MKTVWITGSHGFLGTNLIEQAPSDWDIYKISSTYTEEPKSLVYNSMMWNPLSKLPLPDIVVHLGAISDPSKAQECVQKNVTFTQNILDYLAREKSKCHFVFASSINVYGRSFNRGSLGCDAYTEPTTYYAASKSMCDELLKIYSETTEMNLTSLRFCGIVGKYMTHGIVKDVVDKLHNNPVSIKLWGGYPGTHKSYIHANEACRAIIWASRKAPTDSLIHNVCYSNSALTANSAACIIAQEMGLNPTIEWTNESYKGDYSAPSITKSPYFHPQFNTMKESFTSGVRDYING